MTVNDIIELAKECGFDAVGPMDPSKLQFLPEVREMCAVDRCHSYNRTWNCPPGAGTLEELREKCSSYQYGILAQVIGHREDEFDFEAIKDTSAKYEECFSKLAKALRRQLTDLLPMGHSACRRCKECTYPDAPCRFPDELAPPMEACGLLVSQVCKDNDIPYYYGKDSISFTSCILFNL